MLLSIYAVLSPTEVSFMESMGPSWYEAARRMFDRNRNEFGTNKSLPYFFEDILYTDTGLLDREAALAWAIISAQHAGFLEMTLVKLTVALYPKEFNDLNYSPSGKIVNVGMMAARAFNTRARVETELVSVPRIDSNMKRKLDLLLNWRSDLSRIELRDQLTAALMESGLPCQGTLFVDPIISAREQFATSAATV